MDILKLYLLFFYFSFNIYSQNIGVKEHEQYLNSYIKFGIGKQNNYLNIGGGLFFPLTEKFMAGFRANVNSEIDMFKVPNEGLLDIDLSVRYVPKLWNKVVIMTGVGVGYAKIKKRGKFIQRQLIGLVEEYELEKHKSLSVLAEIEIGLFLTKFLGVSASTYSVITSHKNIYTYQVGLFLYRLSNQ